MEEINVRELIEDNIYTILANEYNELLLDYVLLSFNDEYCGQESHKKVVIEAILIFNTRKRVGNSLEHPYFYVDENKMCCVKYSVEDFFCNSELWGSITSSFSESYMTYWGAFSDQPYPTTYSKEDFYRINDLLFPIQFRNELEIYIWNDEFSNYFDDGKDWWGTALWSVYDKQMNRFVIIGASLSD
jgi:hypothetical protein